MENLYSDIDINNDESNLNTRPFQSDGKTVNYPFPKFTSLIKEYPNLIKKLQVSLKGRQFLVLDKDKKVTFISYENKPLKFLEEHDLNVISHDTVQQTWLKTESMKWKNIIAALQKLHFCAIFNEEDFSKTYVCSTVKDSAFILLKISEFLDNCPGDIKITPHFYEFMKHNKKFSHLKMEETAQGEIWIRNISKSLILSLKKEIRNVNCQSYLLDEDQYVFLFEMKNILSNIEKKFQVKSQISFASIPRVVEVNPLTNVSYMFREQSGNIPVDNLIILDHQKPSKDFTLDCDRHRYKIWKGIPSDIPANQVVYAEICSEEFKLSSILEDCLRKIYCSSLPVTVLGILPSPQIIQKLEAFIHCLTLVVEYLQEEQVQIPHHYIMVILENTETVEKFQHEFFNEIPVENEDEKRDSLILNLIEGDLTDQKVDAIVNSTNEKMDLNQGQISQALLKKAGPLIVKECERQNPNGLECLQLFLTKGYGLPCSYVIHGVLPRPYKKSDVSTFVSGCLYKSVQCKFSSIAFPALGTGNLHYPANEVAKEMKESIETFAKRHPHCGLEVNIVVFPGQPDIKKSFSQEFGINFANVPSNLSSNTEKKLLKMPQHKTLRWILFVNYSNEPKNLELALKNLQNELKKVPFIINSVDLEQLLFFTDIFELVPDIISQYSEDKKEVKLFVPKGNLKQLQDWLKGIQKKLFRDELQIMVKLTNKQVGILLQKVRQLHPFIKCQFFDNDQIFSFQGFIGEEIKQAKDLLKSLLGFTHENEFNLERGEAGESINVYDSLAEENVEPRRCFPIADDFFIKVYTDDILNLKVDGIVNIVNNALSFRDESSKAIFEAAGKSVHKEYVAKSKSTNGVIVTSAGNLKQNKCIIHVLTPITSEDEHFRTKVEDIVYHSLMMAQNEGLCSVALSTIISDLNGVLFDACMQGYLNGVMKFYKNRQPNYQLREVHLVDLSPSISDSIIHYFSQQLNGASAEIRRDHIHQSQEIYENLYNEDKSEKISG